MNGIVLDFLDSTYNLTLEQDLFDTLALDMAFKRSRVRFFLFLL